MEIPATGLHRTWLLDLDLAILGEAVFEVEIDEGLIGNASLSSHVLEVLNHVF